MVTSVLDSSKQLDKNLWGVTLIKVERKSSQHAQLIFEGMNDSGYFALLAHLTGPTTYQSAVVDGQGSYGFYGVRAVIKMQQIDPKKLHYGAKGKTLLLTKEKIEKVIKSIELERDQFHMYPVTFNIFGHYSIFSKAVPVLVTDNPELQQIQRTNPAEFYSLYNQYLAQKCTPLQFRVSKHYVPQPTFGQFLARSVLEAWNPFSIGTEHAEALRKAKENERLVSLCAREVRTVQIQPDSCVTWAWRKLSELTPLPKMPKVVIGTITTSFLDQY